MALRAPTALTIPVWPPPGSPDSARSPGPHVSPPGPSDPTWSQRCHSRAGLRLPTDLPCPGVGPVEPGSSAGYNPAQPWPGLLVSRLPHSWTGPGCQALPGAPPWGHPTTGHPMAPCQCVNSVFLPFARSCHFVSKNDSMEGVGRGLK